LSIRNVGVLDVPVLAMKLSVVSPAHIPEETLEQYAIGALPVVESGPLEEHLLVCERCQERLTTLDEIVALMRSGLRELPDHCTAAEIKIQ
jgi:anti-sigma factor RsiW